MPPATTRRVRILVKAYPQPSTKYEETVCCAGIDEETRELLRLFPIRYRRLAPPNRFDRFDQVEMTMTKASSDPRPESFHVNEDSIRLTETSSKLSPRSKVQLWAPFVAESLTALQDEYQATKRSLGIIRPDPGSVTFKAKQIKDANTEDQDLTHQVFQQASLLEDSLKPLQKPEYSFAYSFTSASKPHTYQIHDWEVQAAYFNFRRKYGDEALSHLVDMYENTIPHHNLHLIMGTMQKRPWQFIIIGLLRSQSGPADLEKQGELF